MTIKDTRQKAKITKKLIQSINPDKGHRVTVSDTGKDSVTGFRCILGEESKTFVLEKRITGVTKSARKFKIGSFPEMTVEQAREIAGKWSVYCREGMDPTTVLQERGTDGVIYTLKKKDVKTMTVWKALLTHFEYKDPEPNTKVDYRSSITTQLTDWKDTPLDDIKMEDLVKRGQKIAKEVSPSRARKVLQHLRAIWNTAKTYCDTYEYSCPPNPLMLMQVNKMFNVEENQVVIEFTRVGEFIDLLEQMVKDTELSPGYRRTARVYQVSLFLGMRNEEARLLRWEYLDLNTGYFILPGKVVKNKKKHIKPICKYVLTILREMYEEREPGNPWVFPTTSVEKQHQGKNISCYRWVQGYVVEKMGIDFAPHALRRTFISLADEISIPRKVLKNLVNHISGDVTDKYCVKGFNPKKEGPYLGKIEKAFLILRDMFRNGEELPDVTADIFPKEDSAEIVFLREELAKRDAQISRIHALEKELAETKAALAKANQELARRPEAAPAAVPQVQYVMVPGENGQFTMAPVVMAPAPAVPGQAPPALPAAAATPAVPAAAATVPVPPVVPAAAAAQGPVISLVREEPLEEAS